MAIRAIVSPSMIIHNSISSNRYFTNWEFCVLNDDDRSNILSTGSGELSVLIAFSLNLRPRKIDDYIRKTIADMIFEGLVGTGGSQSSAGWVIDPDDIYFPMMMK